MQLALRRRYARLQARRQFPSWPAEDILLRRRDEQLRDEMTTRGTNRIPLVGYWPAPHRWAYVITHDVEGEVGIEHIAAVLDLEEQCGIVSSWNFCGDWYRIPEGTFERLRSAGCEIGLHGIRHDGRLFSSRADFEANLPEIRRRLADWGVDGFRSPAMHRNADWIHEIGSLYDSSFPDTDPFEPQGGGCCSILPFFFGDVVELPVTLVQDHTMWEILRRTDIELWTSKTQWIAERNGLVNVIVHPDYLGPPRHFQMYEQLLRFLSRLDGGWHALPRDVAAWWRDRNSLEVRSDGDGDRLEGPRTAATGAAAIWWACDDGMTIRLGP